MEAQKETETNPADTSPEDFSFSSVGFYMRDGKLVPVNQRAQQRYSALMRKEIELSNVKPKP